MSRVQRTLSSLILLAILFEVIGFATVGSFNPATLFTEASIALLVVLSVLAALMFGNLLGLLTFLLGSHYRPMALRSREMRMEVDRVPREPQGALEEGQRLLAMYREVGDRFYEADVLTKLGERYHVLGQIQEALEHYQLALAIHREVGDSRREYTILTSLCRIYSNLGLLREALEHGKRALDICREEGYRAGEGAILTNLGVMYQSLGRTQEALAHFQEALAISREVGDRAYEGTVLANLGSLYGDLGQPQESLEHFQQALAIFREVGDRSGEGAILTNLGQVFRGLGRPEQALECYREALAIARQRGDRDREEIVLKNLALYKDLDRTAAAEMDITRSEGRLEAPRSVFDLPRPGEVSRASPDMTSRLTDVTFPEQVSIGQRADLNIRIILEKVRDENGQVITRTLPHHHDEKIELELPEMPAEPDIPPPDMVVDLVVHAPRFDVEPDDKGQLRVPVYRDSDTLTFGLTAKEKGQTKVAVDFFREGHPVGSVVIPVAVGEPLAEGAKPSGGEVVLRQEQEAADLLVLISQETLPDGSTYLHFIIHSPLPELNLHYADAGGVDLRQLDPEAFMSEHLAVLSKLASSKFPPEFVENRVAGIGRTLYDEALPEEFKILFWRVHDKVQSVEILSDEPWIPWELVKPVEVEDGTEKALPFWCERYQLARWVRGGKSMQPTLALGDGRIVAVDLTAPTRGGAPKGRSKSSRLPTRGGAGEEEPLLMVEEEVRRVRDAVAPEGVVDEVPPRLKDVLGVLESGGFDFLHFACHGQHHEAVPALASLELEDGQITPADLNPPFTNFGNDRPLVFLNACHTARKGFGLTKVGGWADRLISVGCSAFVGSFWPVADHLAGAFAEAFYERLKQGVPLAEAFRQARLHIRDMDPSNPTWLAYCLYGDPLARVEASRESAG